jgi:hypothetical protein
MEQLEVYEMQWMWMSLKIQSEEAEILYEKLKLAVASC